VRLTSKKRGKSNIRRRKEERERGIKKERIARID
jgi:hypothetical protein